MPSREEALARLRGVEDTVEPGRVYAVHAFRPEDAEGVAKLFHTVYGESYPMDLYYIPDRLREVEAKGEVRSMVARLEGGEVVGHVALYRSSAPFDGLLEIGLGMVHPAYRGAFTLFHVFSALMQGPAAEPGVKALFGEAVCNHIMTQHLSMLYGLRECALELDPLPGTGQGRVSCLCMARESPPLRLVLHAPRAYADRLAFLLSGSRLEREVVPAAESLSPRVVSRWDEELFPAAGLLRVNVFQAGGDFENVVRDVEDKARAVGCRVFQWIVDLGQGESGAAVDVLRGRGYFLGGLMPRWFDSDGLLMQKLLDEPGWERAQLYSDHAKEMLEIIREDCGRP